MYALNKRFGPYDQWTVDTFNTVEELAEEIAYLLEEGWYIGKISTVDFTSIDASKCEAVAGDEDSFSNLGV